MSISYITLVMKDGTMLSNLQMASLLRQVKRGVTACIPKGYMGLSAIVPDQSLNCSQVT